MSIHKECGAEIRWAKRSDDPERWSSPLEFAGFNYIIDESGSAIEVVAYKIHVCDLEQMTRWRDVVEKTLQARDYEKKDEPFNPFKDLELTGRDAYNIKREEQRKENWKIAKKVECPTCNAAPRNKCVSLAKGPSHGKTTKNPHPNRLTKAMENNGTE